MSRIDKVIGICTDCTGCMACVDVCPYDAIMQKTDENGFLIPGFDDDKCRDCGKCVSVCPACQKPATQCVQHLYAAYAKNAETRNGGSSGVVFGLLAERLLADGYYVCGAAFDDQLTLKHVLIKHKDELEPLLKSKYLQSDTAGIFHAICDLLKQGQRVFFAGTPCQVAALKNTVPKQHLASLLTADIICHGVPSQAMFSSYIKSLEHRHGGKITEFKFRVKDNRYRHPYGFSYTVDRNGIKQQRQGLYTQSDFYYGFKQQLTFRNSCYRCRFTTIERCSDLTLADFWGIEKFNKTIDGSRGVSMLITNSSAGETLLFDISKELELIEYPLEYGIESNFSLTHMTPRPANYEQLFREYRTNGYDSMAHKYLSGRNSVKHRIYRALPACVRNAVRKFRGGK